MKRENPRQDIVSRQSFPREELVRFVIVLGELRLMESGGRGRYIHKDRKSLETAIRKHVFERFLHRPLNEAELAALKEAL